MDTKRGSSVWRWLGGIALAVTVWPHLEGAGTPRNHAVAVAPGEQWDVPGEIVVDLKKDAAPSDLQRLSQTYGVSLADSDPVANQEHILTVTTDLAAAPALLSRLRQDPAVEAAEPQRLFKLPQNEMSWKPAESVSGANAANSGWQPNDPRYPEQWNFRRIETEKAWPITHGRGAIVAVIDTGVAFEDGARGRTAKDFKDTRFVQPYDFVHRDKHPYDDNGHGTHVAGTIAESTNNGEGVAGIAFEAQIMPIKVLSGTGSGRMSDVAAGIRYAADHGANVINMSLGAPFPDSITRNACKYARGKGVTIVCAAGNSGSEGVGYPAAYPECVAVSALGPTGELAPYSSWGDPVAVSAPGGDKTRGDGAGILQNTVLDGEDGYFAFQGTSMACPHAAAVAALIVSQGVKDPGEVRSILQKSATSRGPRNKFGAGEINAGEAAKRARSEAGGYYGNLWFIGIVWAVCLALGGVFRRLKMRPWVPALALSLGIFFPDLISAFAGFESSWNVLGHSVLIPAFLLISEAESGAERRFYGLFAAGLVWHLVGDLAQGTAPLLGAFTWAALPWLWTNIAVGFGTLLAGFRK